MPAADPSARPGGSPVTTPAVQQVPVRCAFDIGWLRAWAAGFVGVRGWRGPLREYAAEDPRSGTRAVVGFARQRMGPVHVAALAGYYWPCRAVGVPVGSAFAEAAARLAEAVAGRPPGPCLRVGPVMGDDAATQAFLASMQNKGWRRASRDGGSTFRLPLPPQVADLERVASLSMLKNLAYLRRRLQKDHGEVTATRHRLGADTIDGLLGRLAGIEAASWVSGDGGEPKFRGPANRAFWSAVAAQADGGWQAVVWVLAAGGRDIAFSAHVETDEMIWIVANSYDAAWKAHSPGSLLTLDVLREAIGRGVRLVDWGQGDSGYKGRWGAQPGAALQEHLLFAPHALGRLMHLAGKRLLRGWTSP